MRQQPGPVQPGPEDGPLSFQAWVDTAMDWWIDWLTEQIHRRLCTPGSQTGPVDAPAEAVVRQRVRARVTSDLADKLLQPGCEDAPIHDLVRAQLPRMAELVLAAAEPGWPLADGPAPRAGTRTESVRAELADFTDAWWAPPAPVEQSPATTNGWERTATIFVDGLTLRWLLAAAALAQVGYVEHVRALTHIIATDVGYVDDWHGVDSGQSRRGGAHRASDGPRARCLVCTPGPWGPIPALAPMLAEFLVHHVHQSASVGEYLRALTWLANIPDPRVVLAATKAGLDITETAQRWAACTDPALPQTEQERRVRDLVAALEAISALARST